MIRDTLVGRPVLHDQTANIDSLVASGAFASTSEVVRAGLRALREREAAVDRWLERDVVHVYDAVHDRAVLLEAAMDTLRGRGAAGSPGGAAAPCRRPGLPSRAPAPDRASPRGPRPAPRPRSVRPPWSLANIAAAGDLCRLPEKLLGLGLVFGLELPSPIVQPGGRRSAVPGSRADHRLPTASRRAGRDRRSLPSPRSPRRSGAGGRPSCTAPECVLDSRGPARPRRNRSPRRRRRCCGSSR